MLQYSGTNFLYDMQVPIWSFVFPLTHLGMLFYMDENFHSNSLPFINRIGITIHVTSNVSFCL